MALIISRQEDCESKGQSSVVSCVGMTTEHMLLALVWKSSHSLQAHMQACPVRRYRLVVDESLALGVLGQHGRGACEHWGLRPGDAEVVSASMGALCDPETVKTPSIPHWQMFVLSSGYAALYVLAYPMLYCGGIHKMCMARLQATHWRLWAASVRETGR